MTSPANSSARLWTSATYHPAFRCGGWAYVRLVDGERTGAAGGDRGAGPWRTELAGLTAAFRGLPEGAAVTIHSANPSLRTLGALLAAGAAPTELEPADGPAWAAFVAAVAGRKVTAVRTAPDKRSPTAFVAAWAELARDKAKAAGAFTSPIPKTNLAKLSNIDA